jgi:predicted nucleic acid-binding protein
VTSAILDASIYIGQWGRAKRRDFQNDTLIALTARRRGTTVVTASRADFALLARAVWIAVVLA